MNYKTYIKEFNESKYAIWYFNIIDNALQDKRQRGEQYEKHHILPSCIYPKYKNLRTCTWNAVYLTPREHFICHWLLTKCFNSHFIAIKMCYAFQMMRMDGNKTNRNLTSGQYNAVKIVANKINRGTTAPMFGKKHTEETKRKISEAVKARPKRILHPEELERLRTCNIGRNASQETIKKKSEWMLTNNPFRGKVHTEEVKEAHSKRMQGTLTINKDGTTKRIKRTDLAKYIDNGWCEGFLITQKMLERNQKSRGKKFINNGAQTKLVCSKQLEEYLGNGWKLGQLSRK